jgi:hypothetical protein
VFGPSESKKQLYESKVGGHQLKEKLTVNTDANAVEFNQI